ncbi:hypothetical protein BLNAU_21232 [Blattamonas nauphoetae]|uniref:Uncharacterized protein n=1 Tax=Blattamonas nauphoetae TaxID=2049346 RepID=A0ABQ9WZL0_9EUKA|nr:hypothetical protein BLNAU_21232 [Blattamonas nauphoetae]
MSFTSSSEGKSPRLSIGTPNHLQYSETYTIESITKVGNFSEQIRFDTSLTIETGPKPAWLTIAVEEGGTDETKDCGSDENPCGSVVSGWRAGQRKPEGDGIRIEIKKQVGFGERIWVESEQLVIQSTTGNRSRLMCDSSLFGTDDEYDRKLGIVTIGGGFVGLSRLVLSLPSTSSDEVGGCFVVCGKGSFLVESVQIFSEGDGRVGMGVGWVEGGEIDVNGVVLANASLTVTLFGGEDEHEDIHFSVCELRVENTTTFDALIHFCSLSPSSSFSLSRCSFLTTVRTTDSAVSSSSQTNLSLISVSTCQDLISVVDCVFEKSGTCHSSSPSTFTGNTLRIALSSPFRCESKVVISSCLFVDCLSVLSDSGALHISTGTCSARIVLSNNWFENLASGEEWPLRKGGVAQLDWSRLASVTTPSSPTCAVGVLVDSGTFWPTIVRRRCVFCHSRIFIQKSE